MLPSPSFPKEEVGTMNTRLYRPDEIAARRPSPGDTIMWRNGRVTMVLRRLNDKGTSAEISPEPECLRCHEHLSYDAERIEWVCHSCGHVPSEKEVRKIAITSAATGRPAACGMRPAEGAARTDLDDGAKRGNPR